MMFRIYNESTNERIDTANDETEALRKAKEWARRTCHTMYASSETAAFYVEPDGAVQTVRGS